MQPGCEVVGALHLAVSGPSVKRLFVVLLLTMLYQRPVMLLLLLLLMLLLQARKFGTYLIAGVHGDDVVNARRGLNMPIMNLNERVLR
jgi:hypothetical protein